MTSSELESRNIALSMRKSVENLVISSQDAIGQSISQALTFSGVITHSSQILHENRNISRSPSPSLRITDAAAEAIENDKNSDIYSQAADSISVSSSELPPSGKLDNLKGLSNPSSKSSDAGGAVRAKKKSWYNALYPTYKSKSDDFKRLFKDLPDDERLIVDYSCALQKDILAHGRLYASQNYLCFYANIFGWETSLTLRWKEVTAITKEKTALVIPNAILVCTDGEKNFLTSFSGRDKAYLMLFRIWQNALMDQSMNSQEIWQWVHSCYGEELGFNSDDEEYSRDFADDPAASDVLPEEIGESCTEAGGGEQRDERRDERRPARHLSHRDSSPPLVHNGDGVCREEDGADALPTDMSDTSDSDGDNKNSGGEAAKCTNPHDGKLLMKQTFAFNIDQLFTMIFTNSRFSLELLAARSITDYVQSQWQPQSGLRCRQMTYKLGLTTGPIGPKEVHVTETQMVNKCSKPGALYSIDSSSDNAGIPYADYFSVAVHYCLRRVADASTELQLYGQIKFKKTTWPMAKTFLEKSTMNGLEEFGRLLESRLAAEADVAVPLARKARRPRRLTMGVGGVSAAGAALGGAGAAGAGGGAARGRRWAAPLLALLLLLALNAALYWLLARRHPDPPERHQLAATSRQLTRALDLLQQTEEAITKLLEAIRPSLEKAQRDDARDDL